MRAAARAFIAATTPDLPVTSSKRSFNSRVATAAAVVPESTGRIIEIGGSEVVTYGEMMMIYAEARGLKRWMLPVPVLTPRLSSYWVNIVTPIPGWSAKVYASDERPDDLAGWGLPIGSATEIDEEETDR